MSSFEIKGKVAPCTLFRPLTINVDDLARDLQKRLQQAPAFFRDLAVIIDLSGLDSGSAHLDLATLVQLLRAKNMMLIGIQGGNEFQNQEALKLNLAIFPVGQHKDSPRPAPEQSCPQTEPKATLVVDKPVRSGQQIYAKGADLIVTAPVGPGAEVIADGHIHVYAPLRGRALAGVMGFEGARIFCHELHAELVSVAGLYRVNEDIPSTMLGAPAQIRLAGRQLFIESF